MNWTCLTFWNTCLTKPLFAYWQKDAIAPQGVVYPFQIFFHVRWWLRSCPRRFWSDSRTVWSAAIRPPRRIKRSSRTRSTNGSLWLWTSLHEFATLDIGEHQKWLANVGNWNLIILCYKLQHVITQNHPQNMVPFSSPHLTAGTWGWSSWSSWCQIQIWGSPLGCWWLGYPPVNKHGVLENPPENRGVSKL